MVSATIVMKPTQRYLHFWQNSQEMECFEIGWNIPIVSGKFFCFVRLFIKHSINIENDIIINQIMCPHTRNTIWCVCGTNLTNNDLLMNNIRWRVWVRGIWLCYRWRIGIDFIWFVYRFSFWLRQIFGSKRIVNVIIVGAAVCWFTVLLIFRLCSQRLLQSPQKSSHFKGNIAKKMFRIAEKNSIKSHV